VRTCTATYLHAFAPKRQASMSCWLLAALSMLACIFLPWTADWGVPWLSQPIFACRYVGVGTPQMQRPASAGALLQSTISALSTLAAPVSADLNSDGEASASSGSLPGGPFPTCLEGPTHVERAVRCTCRRGPVPRAARGHQPGAPAARLHSRPRLLRGRFPWPHL
jgi:hypothetical protein